MKEQMALFRAAANFDVGGSHLCLLEGNGFGMDLFRDFPTEHKEMILRI